MKLYKIGIKAKSSCTSPLHSDTFSGAFCWSYSYIYGNEALKELIEMFKNQNVPLIFSNAFPAGTLPMPIGIKDIFHKPDKYNSKSERLKSYKNHKKIKNTHYLSTTTFNNLIYGNSAGFLEGIRQEMIISLERTRNIVDRLTGTVSGEDGGLFSVNENYYQSNLEIYILTKLKEEVLKKTLNLMFTLGIGSDKSSGKGVFEIINFELFKGFGNPNKPNAFITLSNFIPAATDPVSGYYKMMVKYGRVDREFASSPTPFKKPLVYIKAGSLFFTKEIKQYFGRAVFNISSLSRDIFINGYCIAIPAYIPINND